MKCFVCKKNEAVKHDIFGWIPCISCRQRQSSYQRPNKQVEFTTDNIKEQRKEFVSDTIQPFRSGELSKEYVERYGKKGIEGVTEKDVKKSKYVWDSYYSK